MFITYFISKLQQILLRISSKLNKLETQNLRL